MAEQIVSPGVFTRENDQSFISQQPVEVGAAIIGPAVKGPVEVPTVVTSYSQYENIFGAAFLSSSQTYSFLTSVSAYNYFQNGGDTLLVTRVASGSFTAASSSTIPNDLESGVIATNTNLVSSRTSGGTGGTSVGTFTAITPTTGGSGTGLIATVITTTGDTFLAAKALTISPSQTADSAGTTAALATAGTGLGATVTVTSDGVNITGATISTVGTSGYVAGDTITVTKVLMDADGSIGTVGADLVITITQGDLESTVTSVTVTTEGTGYSVEDQLTFTAASIGTPTADLILTLVDADIVNKNAFTLKTLSEGVIMNSAGGTEGADGSLPTGSINNVRWEITQASTSSGTFTINIRQGNDITNEKIVLETFANVSLDPESDNYISKVIGDTYATTLTDGDGNSYIQPTGNFPNNSSYVYVSEVVTPTPNYFNNSGNAKTEFTASIPMVSNGAFGGALGDILTGDGLYYENITDDDTQGLVAGNYSVAISLLNNKDAYQYNVISTPGLIHTFPTHASVLNTLIANTQNRGDSIAIVDLENYGATITATSNAAVSINSSYAAAYWPWLQITNPNTGKLNWTPASTLIPGVYAFNDASSEPWFAPAGINRGGLSTVVRPERKLTRAQRDTLYESNVNPIANFPNTGTVVFGQKTLQKKASALDRVNVRRLLIALKSYIGQVANNLVFEQNSIATRNSFLAQVNPYMESVQQRQGVYAFKVVMDSTNNTPDVVDRNQMVGQIFLQPTRTAEFIILDFNVLPTGAEFPA
ncbi:phage tail sheath subtilisin-like domain-containing protein [bacterium]|nr:phage tail sheath subtilisin-like domain-containing protein [bacterium]